MSPKSGLKQLKPKSYKQEHERSKYSNYTPHLLTPALHWCNSGVGELDSHVPRDKENRRSLSHPDTKSIGVNSYAPKN